jgi:choloylglycine hydrolase
VTNLNTLVNVQAGTAPPRSMGAHEISSFGAGTASLGLPGDISPSSRFVRAAFYRSTVPPLETSLEAVSQAFHILSNFDIPIGVVFGADQRQHIPNLPSSTQWTAASDLGQRMFYFRTMHDSAVKRVDLGRLELTADRERAYALDEGRFTFEDVTP